MPSDFPVGTILPFVGPSDHASLATNDWMLCGADEKLQAGVDKNQALENCLRGSFGTSSGYFYLPDLRGYFLRGVDPGGGGQYGLGVDPDGDTRTAVTPPGGSPGAAGRNVGSVQGHAVGPHVHPIQMITQREDLYPGSGHNAISGDQSHGGWSTTGAAGTGEARPQNLAVYFVIKHSTLAGSSAIPGLVVFYAGDPAAHGELAGNWLPCDGAPLPTDSYGDLYNVIVFTHGRTADGRFCVPDMRAMFLRGVDPAKPPVKDPDAQNRESPRPDLTGGAAGSAGASVGSFQPAQLGSHTHDYDLPNTPVELYQPTVGGTAYLWWTSTTLTSGDCDGTENRPVNKNVHHLVCWSKSAGQAEIPVGTVIAYAGLANNIPDGWLLCDGMTYPMGGDYAALYNVIGTSYGSIGSQFAVPDYRGYFLRGVSGNRQPVYPIPPGVVPPAPDPDAAARVAPRPDFVEWGGSPGNAGNAVGSQQPYSVTPHHHTYTSVNLTQQWSMLGPTPTFGPGVDQGGTQVGFPDAETRPPNMYVHFLIKAR